MTRTQPATACLDWDKCFPVRNRHHAGQEDCFLNPFVHRKTEVAHSEPTKAFSKQSPETVMCALLVVRINPQVLLSPDRYFLIISIAPATLIPWLQIVWQVEGQLEPLLACRIASNFALELVDKGLGKLVPYGK